MCMSICTVNRTNVLVIENIENIKNRMQRTVCPRHRGQPVPSQAMCRVKKSTATAGDHQHRWNGGPACPTQSVSGKCSTRKINSKNNSGCRSMMIIPLRFWVASESWDNTNKNEHIEQEIHTWDLQLLSDRRGLLQRVHGACNCARRPPASILLCLSTLCPVKAVVDEHGTNNVNVEQRQCWASTGTQAHRHTGTQHTCKYTRSSTSTLASKLQNERFPYHQILQTFLHVRPLPSPWTTFFESSGNMESAWE